MSLRTIILSIVFGIAASQFLLLPLDGGVTGAGLFGREVLLLLSSLPIFLSVLGFGQLAGLLTIGVAVLLNFLLSGSWVLAVFSFLNCLPPLLLGSVALLRKITAEEGAESSHDHASHDQEGRKVLSRRGRFSISVDWVSGELIVVALVSLGVLTLIGIFAAIGLSGTAEPVSYLSDALSQGLETLIAPMTVADLTRLAGDPKIVESSLLLIARYPAILVTVWLLVLAVNGVLAQGLLMRFNDSLRPAPAIGQISMPYWYSSAAIVLAILSFAGANWLGFIASNLLVILAIGLMFGGLGVVHVFSMNWSFRGFWLGLGYVLLVLSQGFLMVPLVILGTVWPFVRMRQRIID